MSTLTKIAAIRTRGFDNDQAIVSYLPDTEYGSHCFAASLPLQFDAMSTSMKPRRSSRPTHSEMHMRVRNQPQSVARLG
jgi:hypothetical protein